MADWAQKQLETLGVKVDRRALGKHSMDGKELELPPVLFGASQKQRLLEFSRRRTGAQCIAGTYGSDPKKKTILVYGHLDVQPANKEDGWNTEPFKLTHDKDTDRLYGRGSTDDKGPCLGWINVIEAHQKTNTEFPVNLKMCFEGMEESGSEGLDELIRSEASGFLSDVVSFVLPPSVHVEQVSECCTKQDAVCISDNYWLGTKVSTSIPKPITADLILTRLQKPCLSGLPPAARSRTSC